MPSVLIVDDDEDMRILARLTIARADEDLHVIGEAHSGREGIELCRTLRPDLVVMDQRMPGIDGLRAAEEILAEFPEQRIVMFTAFLDEKIEATARAIGILACIPKTDIESLPAHIRACV